MKHLFLLLFGLYAVTIVSAQVRPTMTSHTPVTGAMSVLQSVPLSISFSKPVTKGSGNIYIRNRNLKTTKTIAAASSDVTVSSSLVLVNNVGMINGCAYHVTFDSTAFDSSGYRCTGLYDTTTWWYRTSGTGVGVADMAAASLPVTMVSPGTNGLFNLNCTLPQAAIITVRVYDMNGRDLASKSFFAAQGENQLPLYTALPTGTYLIHVDNGKLWGSIKAVMQ